MFNGVRHPALATAVLALILALVTVGCAAQSAQPGSSVAPLTGRTGTGGGSGVPLAASSVPLGPSPKSAPSHAPAASAALRPTSSAPPPSGTRPIAPSSPMLFPRADDRLLPDPAADGAVRLNSSDGQTRDGKPYRPKVFTASNLWLTPVGGRTAFDLAIDAGRTVGAATQARVSYDLTGDGRWDRVETYQYFATDPESGLEHYTQDAGLLSSSGSLGELTGGVVRLEVWSALGDGTTVDLAASSLTLPYA